jgi:hypothetical protein
MDKKDIYHYLKKPMSADESRVALYKVACIACDLGWNFMESSLQLGEKAVEDGLSKELVEATLRKAFAKDRRKAEREPSNTVATGSPDKSSPSQLELDEESLELLHSHRINPDALSIPWPSDDWRKDLIKLLQNVFEPDETIAFKMAGTPDIKEEKVSTILQNEGGINKIMRSLDGEEGALLSINALAKENATDEKFKFRYVIVDSPQISLSKQLAYYKALNLPCVALVNSGANSVQAWIRVDAFDQNEYSDRVDFLYSILEEQGFKVDHSNKRHGMLVRMPGVLRNGKQQYLIGLNDGAESWEKWEEWVDYCLDGNPIAEQASYHNTPPSQEPEIVIDVLRRSQNLIITGPPKCGKSFLAQSLALAVCHGKTWLGKRTGNSDVLFVNFEQDKASFINRIHIVAEARTLAPDTEKLGFFHLRGFPKYGLDLAQFISKRVRGARKHEGRNYDLILIDPLHKVLPPGISPEQMAPMLRQFVDHLSTTAGAAVVGVLPDDLITDTSWADGIINMHAHAGDPYIQVDGIFKSFPNMGPLECKWNYPVLRVES